MTDIRKLDLHMHSAVSDGSDTAEELIAAVKAAGMDLFSLTDHDAISGCNAVRSLLKQGDPAFICGVEFSCRDDEGKYHILGYGYDPVSPYINDVVDTGHDLRMNKAKVRADFVVNELGLKLPEEEIDEFLSLPNPGKPHLGNLLVKYGYAPNMHEAIQRYINKAKTPKAYISPEYAIEGIKKAGGIPVLAHPVFGSGGELIRGDEMDKRLRKLMDFGLEGVEAFYSEFTPDMTEEMISFAVIYGLYVTAGSDYHGKNKTIPIGGHNLEDASFAPEGLISFIEKVTRA